MVELPNTKPMALFVFSPDEVEAAATVPEPKAGELTPKEKPPFDTADVPTPKVDPDPAGAGVNVKGFEGALSVASLRSKLSSAS